MKRLILSLVAIATISLSSFGQAPEGFKYQAVVRDAGNIILNNQSVGMQMTIQQGSIGGVTVYQETFSLTTNAYGLVNLEIGSGTVVSGDFTTIDWSVGSYFIETAVDVTGGTSYAVMGTSQLMSVPYALYAKTSGSSTPGPPGPQGPIGNDGAIGATGPQGPIGNDGAIGATGPQGPIGNDGAAGATGAQGPIGNDGAIGATGAQGAVGNDGAVGATGAQGAVGNDGAVGATGPQGPIGLTGSTGAAGTNGIAGAAGPIGPIGLTGLTGSTGAAGQGGVTQAAGANVTITGTGTTGDPYTVSTNFPPPNMGDGILDVCCEECDDGNTVNGDGCDEFGRVEIQPSLDQVLVVGNDAGGSSIVNTGQIGIGTATPNPNTSVEISTPLPLIMPRMTQTEIDMITPIEGMMQYNTSLQKLQVYEMAGGIAEHNNEFMTGESGHDNFFDQTITPDVTGTIIAISFLVKDNGLACGFLDFSLGGLGYGDIVTVGTSFGWQSFVVNVPCIAGSMVSLYMGPCGSSYNYATNNAYIGGSGCCFPAGMDDVVFRLQIQTPTGLQWVNLD